MNEKTVVLSGHIFLTSLIADHSTFADEVDKFHYLKSLDGVLKSSGCSGISFVLTDDVFRLIFFAEMRETCFEDQLLGGFHRDFLPRYMERHPGTHAVNVRAETLPLEGERQLLEETLELHLLPKRLGLVDFAADWWWASIQSYLGHYSWDFIEQSLLLSTLCEDEIRARKKLNRYAKNAFFREFGTEFGYCR